MLAIIEKYNIVYIWHNLKNVNNFYCYTRFLIICSLKQLFNKCLYQNCKYPYILCQLTVMLFAYQFLIIATPNAESVIVSNICTLSGRKTTVSCGGRNPCELCPPPQGPVVHLRLFS